MNNIHDEKRLLRFDFNLFRVFATIYREGSLTRAADHLALSQSAISHSLARMREQLSDPLFTREGSGVVPTPLANRLWPSIRQGVGHFSTALQQGAHFCPQRDLSNVVLGMNDQIEPTILPACQIGLSAAVPGIVVKSVRIERTTLLGDLVSGRIDLAVDVFQRRMKGLCSELIRTDSWVVATCNPRPPTREAYMAAEHVVVSSRRHGRVVEDFELSRVGVVRRIASRCQQYDSACRLAARTDLLLTLPAGIANAQLNIDELFLHPMPIPLPDVNLHLWWAQERDNDPANRWLRDTVTSTLERADPG